MKLEIIANPTNADHDPVRSEFLTDVLRGLSSRPRMLSPRWFYDRTGSELFEKITVLEEYYPTRTEQEILSESASAVAAITGKGRVIVEFGSGSSTKTPVLISAAEAASYVPIDISGEFLKTSAATLAKRFPDLPIFPVEADFNKPVILPSSIPAVPRLGFFPGSTIGNMTEYEAVDLLRNMTRTLGAGSMLLIGMDRPKTEAVLVSAYDDAAGVTAEFNLNLLGRMNRELGADIPLDAFDHEARWVKDKSRIEMHLVANRDVSFVLAGETFWFEAGDSIHTESSHKYWPEEASMLLRAGGWRPVAQWTDSREYFSLILAAYDRPGSASYPSAVSSAHL